ncbi:MAG: tRNA pseudouridine(38-40) synthase TruA, partial [Lysobacterales bacterium]
MRIALGLEYDGTHFHGWQRQSKGAAVQTEQEAALSFVADAPVAVQCAGR